jgi:hypothetical protein
MFAAQNSRVDLKKTGLSELNMDINKKRMKTATVFEAASVETIMTVE